MYITAKTVSVTSFIFTPSEQNNDRRVVVAFQDGMELPLHILVTPTRRVRLYLDPEQINRHDELRRRRDRSVQSAIGKETVIKWPNNAGFSIGSLPDDWKTALDQLVFMTTPKKLWRSGERLRLALGFLNEDIVPPKLQQIIRPSYRFQSPITSVRARGTWPSTP